MGNLTGRQAIRLANTAHGFNERTALLNLVFDVLDGEMVVETVDGDAGVDLTDQDRLRFIIGAVFFGQTGGRFQQAFSSDEGPNLPDPAAALLQLHALLGNLPGAEVEESEVCMAAHGHPVLPSIAAFTCEQGQDGAVAYRLYRNPEVEREKAIGYLQRLLKQFQTAAGGNAGSN